MRKISFADISIFIVNYIFNWRFWIAKLTKQSKIIRKIIDKALFEDDDTTFIPNTININKKIKSEKSEFLPTDVLKEIIKRIDDIVIMDNCLCRTSNNCKNYPQDIGCIFLGPTTKKIPRNICHEASKQEALNHVDKADAAGLTHIIGKNKIDSIWMNVRPRDGLLTICNCCPCCCLWKVIPKLDDKISDKIHKLDGVEIAIDNSKCINCMKCLNGVCMADAINFENDKIQINQDTCRCCGLCVNTCNQNAITINYDSSSINSIVDELYNLVEL
ncbi:ferredoxin [uncultured Methanobrevibacter sp.]|uniref:indolepyruvate ferredoxin oxidoreductase subunit alpha n=1 Tax=uncultured Methanobrevibacter sp. TaxID=253161 RepID=UPI00262DF165|nr:ferredoxin [uncultured Methanobrevibacter sp.]